MAQATPKSETPPTSAAPNAATELPVTLDQFCADLSRSDRRVALIGGFHYSERRAKHVRDTPSAFAKRYKTFAGQPA